MGAHKTAFSSLCSESNDYLALVQQFDDLQPVLDAQLLINVVDMVLDRMGRDKELVLDLLLALALDEQPDNLHLPAGEGVSRKEAVDLPGHLLLSQPFFAPDRGGQANKSKENDGAGCDKGPGS